MVKLEGTSKCASSPNYLICRDKGTETNKNELTFAKTFRNIIS